MWGLEADNELVTEDDLSDEIDGKEDDELVAEDDLSDDVEKVSLVDSSSEDDVGTIKLTNYLDKHEYKVGDDGKHRLKIGFVFKDVSHFRCVLTEVMVRKGFEIKRIYSEPKRFKATCKELNCLWYVYGSRLKDKIGFILREYYKKHECRQTLKGVNVSPQWIKEKIMGHVTVDPCIKNEFHVE